MTTSKSELRKLAKESRARSFAAAPDLAAAIKRAVDLVKVKCDQSLKPNSHIAIYLPIRDEMPTTGLISALWQAGAALCLPHVTEDGRALKFYPLTPESPLRSNRFGIDEIDVRAESGASDILPEIFPGIIFVPLLAFDRSGARMGYGRGHYDATIKHLRSFQDIITIGWAYDSQLWPHNLPTEKHDERLDMVITEKDLYIF